MIIIMTQCFSGTDESGNPIPHENGNQNNEDSEDDFAGILEDTNSSPRDDKVANLAAVNYKVSMEQYEKVGISKMFAYWLQFSSS